MTKVRTVASITTKPRLMAKVLPAGRVAVQKLKAERVQEEVASRLPVREVVRRMPALPSWRLVAGGKAIEQVRVLSTSVVASMYGSFVSAFAESLGVSAAVRIEGPQVSVRLHTTRSRGRVGALSAGVLGFAEILG